MTRYVYGRKLDPIARASGAGLAAGFRCEALSRLASRHRSRERPERSEEAYLYLLAPRLVGSHHFGRGFHRSPPTPVRIRLARRHQMDVRDRGRISSGAGAARHQAHASPVLFGNRIMCRISSNDTLLASEDFRERMPGEVISRA